MAQMLKKSTREKKKKKKKTTAQNQRNIKKQQVDDKKKEKSSGGSSKWPHHQGIRVKARDKYGSRISCPKAVRRKKQAVFNIPIYVNMYLYTY